MKKKKLLKELEKHPNRFETMSDIDKWEQLDGDMYNIKIKTIEWNWNDLDNNVFTIKFADKWGRKYNEIIRRKKVNND